MGPTKVGGCNKKFHQNFKRSTSHFFFYSFLLYENMCGVIIIIN